MVVDWEDELVFEGAARSSWMRGGIGSALTDSTAPSTVKIVRVRAKGSLIVGNDLERRQVGVT